MTADEIKAHRMSLGLSVRDFDRAIGYETDGRIVMALESGSRHGSPFTISGPAKAALCYLLAINKAIAALERGAPVEGVTAQLRDAAPEGLK